MDFCRNFVSRVVPNVWTTQPRSSCCLAEELQQLDVRATSSLKRAFGWISGAAVQDPEEAHAELVRVIKMGLKGIVIPSNAPRGMRYSDEAYEPMWALAEEAKLPVAFHVACMSHVPDWLKASSTRDPIVQYAGSSALIHDTLVELMVRGFVSGTRT